MEHILVKVLDYSDLSVVESAVKVLDYSAAPDATEQTAVALTNKPSESLSCNTRAVFISPYRWTNRQKNSQALSLIYCLSIFCPSNFSMKSIHQYSPRQNLLYMVVINGGPFLRTLCIRRLLKGKILTHR